MSSSLSALKLVGRGLSSVVRKEARGVGLEGLVSGPGGIGSPPPDGEKGDAIGVGSARVENVAVSPSENCPENLINNPSSKCLTLMELGSRTGFLWLCWYYLY